MQVASCQVFSLIGLVGLLMFFTSFLTIDFHMSNEHPGVHKGHEFFHAPRTKGEFVSDADPVTRTVGAVMDSLKHLHDIHPAEAEAADRLADQHLPPSPSGTDDAHIETPGQDAPKAKPFPAREANELKVTAPDQADSRCKVTFQPKCRINPLVKYWDEVMECYTSPFRDLIGLDAPLEDRKFVVFQADSGGWNNIRMALEVVILFAQVTGRILVLPPNAVLYLLHLNKKWGDNKSSMEDYFDFDKLRASRGLQTLPMSAFLSAIAKNGLLKTPLPNNDTELVRAPLWEYLNSACYVRPWSPGKLFIGFNITSVVDGSATPGDKVQGKLVGSFESTDPARLEEFSLKKKRELLPYDAAMHDQRAIYFPGSEPNRLLTHFYSMLFFATPQEEHRAKRYMRDRLRYHDQIFCTSSEIIEKLLKLQGLLTRHIASVVGEGSVGYGDNESGEYAVDTTVAAKILDIVEYPLKHIDLQKHLENTAEEEDVRSGSVMPTYVAFHIRRGDFQQKHTRLPAEEIVRLTNHLVPNRHSKVAYISTDEGNRSFFEPFMREYGAVYFLADLKNGTDIDEINQNYVGMIEQVVCANADVFIGTPLSTFTAYITRIRGFMNRTITHVPTLSATSVGVSSVKNSVVSSSKRDSSRGAVRVPAAVTDRSGLYNRTYYFMNHHMYMLHTKPHVHFPLWIRDFVDAFENIDDDTV